MYVQEHEFAVIRKRRKRFLDYSIHPLYLEFGAKITNYLLSQHECELDSEFPGFVEIYENLAEIIPTNFIIIDLGCYMAPQCWYFRHHKKYIGVDTTLLKRFTVSNTYHYVSTIENFIKDHGSEFPRATTFAICNYVGYENMSLTKYFPNCFCFYPNSDPFRVDIIERLKEYDNKLGGGNESNH